MDGSTFIGDQQLFLDAVAYDVQDGALGGTNVQWHSDRDGELGAGPVLDFCVQTFERRLPYNHGHGDRQRGFDQQRGNASPGAALPPAATGDPVHSGINGFPGGLLSRVRDANLAVVLHQLCAPDQRQSRRRLGYHDQPGSTGQRIWASGKRGRFECVPVLPLGVAAINWKRETSPVAVVEFQAPHSGCS